ncbi:hypothetical protein B0H10DRAFT_1651791, partial [Mycena sp. CBHHK59/15]
AEKAVNAEKILCYQCQNWIRPEDARTHVGSHIFKSVNGVREANLHEQVHQEKPCGFCGRGECEVDLTGLPTSKTTPKCTSNCPRAHSFSYGHAKKYSVTTPCTNVPLFCTLCPPIPPRKSPAVVWKYSMYAHVKLAHPRYWDDLLSRPKDLPAQLALNIAISWEEMMALGATFGISEA